MDGKEYLDDFFRNMEDSRHKLWTSLEDELFNDEVILSLQAKFLKNINNPINIKGFVYKSPKIQKVMNHLMRIAKDDSNVLIIGSSGTGKESIAKFIHDLSKQSAQKYTVLNCANLTKEIADSALFGHEKGSFTGATTQKKGILEEYRGGTVFLDEVHTLDPSIQSKLLRYVETFKFKRVGGNKDIESKVRLIFASNIDLGISYIRQQNSFKNDLYFRIAQDTLKIPPLSDRGFDIFHLIQFLLNEKKGETIIQLEKSSKPIIQNVLDILYELKFDYSRNTSLIDNDNHFESGSGLLAEVEINDSNVPLIQDEKEGIKLIHNEISKLENEDIQNYAILRILRESIEQHVYGTADYKKSMRLLESFLNYELSCKRIKKPDLTQDIRFSFPDVIDIMHNKWEGNVRELIRYVREFSQKRTLGRVVQTEGPISFDHSRDIFYYLLNIGIKEDIVIPILKSNNRSHPVALSKILTLYEIQPEPIGNYLSIIGLFFGTMEIHHGYLLKDLIQNKSKILRNKTVPSGQKFLPVKQLKLKEYIKIKEKQYIIKIISQSKNLSKKEISDILGIDYSTFYNKCKEYEIDIDKIQDKD